MAFDTLQREPLSHRVAQRLRAAAQTLRTADPAAYVGGLIEDSFFYPPGDPRYARNALTPGAAPLEPMFGAASPRALSFQLEPLGPDADGADRRDVASREMRRLVSENFGREALRWFDGASEAHRGAARAGTRSYGAFFGSSFDGSGLESATVSYEAGGDALGTVNPQLARLLAAAIATVPGMRPVFTTMIAGREHGAQRMTLLLTSALRVADLKPMLDELDLGAKLPQVLQVVGVALGGRFDLPAGSTLVSIGRGPQGAEAEVLVLLDAIPDLPPNFLQLLTMNLRERPRELAALQRFLEAFTPEEDVWPGRFSILGIRLSPQGPAKVSLHLRPIEFEVPPAAALAPHP